MKKYLTMRTLRILNSREMKFYLTLASYLNTPRMILKYRPQTRNNNSNNNIINFKNISVPLSMFIEFKEKVEAEMLDLKDKISILSDKNEELNRSIRNKVSVLTTDQSSIRNKINDMEK
jgi:hypothetical protein